MDAHTSISNLSRATTMSIEQELRDQGLRLASARELGWYVLITGGYRVWATDAACAHPADRLFAWTAVDGTLCVCCCACGAVLKSER